MARSDLLLNLVRAGSRGDQALFVQSVEAIIAEERAKQHHVFAQRLAENLTALGPPKNNKVINFEAPSDFFHEIVPRRSLNDLVLPEQVKVVCQEVVEEHFRADLLRSYGLEPRHRILLAGPPGNGKTSLAEAMAEALMVPLFVVRYESVIGSFLGETSTNLKKVFERARQHRCVLFFDEFDTLGKERGDEHETGEIKRVVSSLLLQIDALPSHVIIVVATNHPELLDRAVWRRFEAKFTLPLPNKKQIIEWLQRFESKLGLPLGTPLSSIASKMEGLSYSDIEQFGVDVHRRYVLSLPSSDLKRIITERLQMIQERAKPTSQSNKQSVE